MGPVLTLSGFILGSVLLWVAVYRATRITPPEDPEMTYIEHAEEARRRFLRIGFFLVYWAFIVLTFRPVAFQAYGLRLVYPTWDVFNNAAAGIYLWIARNTVPEGVELIVTRPTEALAAQMSVGFTLAFFLSLPMILYEAWAFFAPALKPIERRLILVCLPIGVGLFALGAAFAFFNIIPLLLELLFRFADPLSATVLLGASSLVSTVATLALIFGLAFQLPLVMAALAAIDAVQPRTFLTRWRHATVIAFVLAALVTDPTLVSQLIVAACLLVLFWTGVLAAFLVHRPAAT